MPDPSVSSRDETRVHVEAVGLRVAAWAPVDVRRIAQIAAEIHEERDPARLLEAALAAGAGDDTEAVVAVALAFGEVWKVSGGDGVDAYITRNAPHLRALLLFELAHEGAPTDAMRAVAARAGFAAEFASWVAAGTA